MRGRKIMWEASGFDDGGEWHPEVLVSGHVIKFNEYTAIVERTGTSGLADDLPGHLITVAIDKLAFVIPSVPSV